MKNIKYIIISIVFIIFLILLLSNIRVKYFIIKSLGGYTIQNIDTTITTTIDIDTTLIIDKWISANVKLFNPTIIKDTTIVIRKDTNITIADIDIKDIYKYENIISDSLLDGKIITLIDFNNFKLLSQNFDYKPKFPKFITKTITIEKVIEKEYSNYYNIGIGGKFNTLNDIGIIGAYQTNKGWQFQGVYNFSKVNNNYIEVGIIKFF